MTSESPHDEHSVGISGALNSSTSTSSSSLACGGCRKAKLRCSKDRPKCLHCRKGGLECAYETQRGKPGLKAGAVENLHKRLDDLERRMDASTSHESNQDSSTKQHIECGEQTATKVLTLLATELSKLVPACAGTTSPAKEESPQKRRRLDHTPTSPITRSSIGGLGIPELPDNTVLEAIVKAYFNNIHPWIPMIHQSRFLQRLSDDASRERILVVLHAMIIATSRFIPGTQELFHNNQLTRQWVLCAAMEEMSVENLQALIILAWDDIGCGDASKAWSIIGSLTRTVEYMQLTQEHREEEHQPLCRPYTTLEPTAEWTVMEERRRVFWIVFLLDRFCSVTMGWNTSLTAADVHRRLPCDGVLWRKQEVVSTPYFGIWSRQSLGNPIGYESRSPSPRVADTEARIHDVGIPTTTTGPSPVADMSSVGALAYNIEATESMSRVMAHFLQQRVNIRDQSAIGTWLTRFKELDLRLVHWKMLLPNRWQKNPNLTRHVPLMDPNLTAAHVTHNASMILLHQVIAYPPAHWAFRYRLPSACSAEACYMAGVEISTISAKYLSKSVPESPASSQFAFCLFLAARVLLIHWRYEPGNNLPVEFWLLIQSLEEMSRRWTVIPTAKVDGQDLFMKYAIRLRELYESCTLDDAFRINAMDYTNEINHHNHSSTSITHKPSAWPGLQESLLATAPTLNDDWSSALDTIDFNNISDFTLEDFADLDRVIAFDDGSMFAAGL